MTSGGGESNAKANGARMIRGSSESNAKAKEAGMTSGGGKSNAKANGAGMTSGGSESNAKANEAGMIRGSSESKAKGAGMTSGGSETDIKEAGMTNGSGKSKELTPCVAIIGGHGEMGKIFARIFEGQAAQVLIADRQTDLTAEMAVKEAEIVLLAVPMGETLAVIRQLIPLMKEGSLFMDVTSLKKCETEAMLKFSHPGVEILGTHPLFGPYRDIRGQIIALTPVRGRHWLGYIQATFEAAGLVPIMTSPVEHDQAMSVVQALLHVILLSLLGTTQKLGLDPALLNAISTPLYKIVWMLGTRILSHDSNLYRNIAVKNEYSAETLKIFQQTFSQFLNDIETDNGKQFEERFRALRAFVVKNSAGNENDSTQPAGIKQSQQLIDFFSKELANSSFFQTTSRDFSKNTPQ